MSDPRDVPVVQLTCEECGPIGTVNADEASINEAMDDHWALHQPFISIDRIVE